MAGAGAVAVGASVTWSLLPRSYGATTSMMRNRGVSTCRSSRSGNGNGRYHVHARLGQRPPAAISPITCSAVVETTEPVLKELGTPDQGAAWKGFVERVSGEWDGYGADFNFLGEPSELPSQVVPDAFRDWGVEIYDWQTMCPTLGQEEPGILGYKVIRLLPTVGCEADAATPYCIEERDFGTALTYAFHSNGSYNSVWPGKGVVRNNLEPGRTGKIVVRNTENTNEWEVEHCLVKEEGSTRNRARILQHFRIDDTKGPQLKNITVYIEQWDGPFRNGESIGGCSTSGSGFATTEILQPASLAGSWRADSFFADEGNTSPNLLTSKGSSDVERSQGEEIVALPKNLWSSVKASEGATSYTIEAGWLLNPEQIVVSSLQFLPSGDFQASSIRFEQRR